MVVLLVTPLMTIRGLLCISFTFCFIPVLIAAWFLKEQTNRLVPIVLCSFVAILMSLGASLRLEYNFQRTKIAEIFGYNFFIVA